MALLIDPTSPGPITAPSDAVTLPVLTPGAHRGIDSLPVTIAHVPSLQGVIRGDGLTRMRHLTRGTFYPTGLIPPVAYEDADAYGSPGVEGAGRQSYVDLVLNGSQFGYTTGYVVISRRWENGVIGGFITRWGTYVEFQVVGALAAANQYWQIVRQPDPLDTCRVMIAALDADSTTWVEGTDWRAPSVGHASYTGPSYDPGALPNVTPHPFLEAELVGEDTLRFKWRAAGPAGDYVRLMQNCLDDVADPPKTGAGTRKAPVDGAFPTSSIGGTGSYLKFSLSNLDADAVTNSLLEALDGADALTASAWWRITWKTAFSAADGYLQVIKQGNSFQTLCAGSDYFQGISPTWHGGGAHYQAPLPGSTAPQPYWTYSGFELRVLSASNDGKFVDGYILYNLPTSRSNRVYVGQTAWLNIITPPYTWPVTYYQLAGGTDPVDAAELIYTTLSDGSYRYKAGFFRKEDGARSGYGDWIDVENIGGGSVRIRGFPTSPDPGVDFHSVWRTLVNRLGDYFLVEDVPYATTDWLDDYGDGEIAGVWGSLLYDPRRFRSREAGYPPPYKNVVRHLGSIFGCGFERGPIKTGTADFTNGSDVITVARPVIPTDLWAGRSIWKDGEAKEYIVLYVDETTGDVTVNKPYEGETAVAADFVCEDKKPVHQVGRSEIHTPNQWPGAREWEGVDSIHSDGVTAMLPRERMLFLWTRHGIWALTGNSVENFVLDPVMDSVGSVNQRCLIALDNVVYWLEGPAGFYRWDFQGPPMRISNPPFVESVEPRGIQRTVDRINWSAIDWAHGIADPDGRLIRWWVPVDGSEHPNLCITLDTKAQTFSTESCPPITAACTYVMPSGEWIVLAGTMHGVILQLDKGEADGIYGVEPKRQVDAGATTSVIPLKATADLAASMAGGGVLVVYADGSCVERRVDARTKTADLVLTEPLDTAPAEDDLVILGGIRQIAEPNRFHGGIADREKSWPILWVESEVGTGEYYLWVGTDQDELALPYADTDPYDYSLEEGVEQSRIGCRGTQLGFRLETWMPGGQPAWRRFKVQMAVLGRQEAGT